MRERLLVIGDRRRARSALAEQVARILAAVPPGSALVMVREKELDGRALLELARAVGAVARRAGARVVVNDRVDVALAAAADGVHLPEAGFTVEEARALLPRGALVGASVHDEAGARARAAADYVMVGPVWDSPGKAAVGLDAFARVAAAAAPAPAFAVGGIDVARADEALAAGAHGVAVIRALMEAEAPERAAAALGEVILSR